MHPMQKELRLLILAAMAVTGLSDCASTADSGTLHGNANSATVINYGSLLRPRCEDADMKVVNGRREAVCRAYVEAIDDLAVGRVKNETPVTPGSHRMTLRCNYAIIGPDDRGAVPQMPLFERHFDQLSGCSWPG